jgi:hypothetical protein
VGPVPNPTRTSGVNATSSRAYLRRASAFPPATRLSIRMLRLSTQPNRSGSCNIGSMRSLVSASSRPENADASLLDLLCVTHDGPHSR